MYIVKLLNVYDGSEIKTFKCPLYIYRERSYISVHVLLYLLNELRKRYKMRGLPSILSLFCNEYDKFNNTGACMLDSIYHMPYKNNFEISFLV